VTKDVDNFDLVYGNPAKFVCWVDKKGNKLDFDDNISKCGNYKIEKNKLIEIDDI
jgi:hypothetical protein